jgi:hypothetical protein
MNPSADIFEALAQLPDRTPAQRAADERSAAILRAADEWNPPRSRHVCCSCMDWDES